MAQKTAKVIPRASTVADAKNTVQIGRYLCTTIYILVNVIDIYIFLQISNSLKMVDATNKLSRCLHSSCCSNRSKRSMDPENIFGNCAQFRNGKTMYYNGSNPSRV